MRFLPRCVHTVTLLVTVFLFGAVVFFVVGSVGLRSSTDTEALEWITLALPWVLLVLAAWGIWKKFPYALLVPVLVASGGFVIYLAYDNPVPPPPPELGLVTPANSRSYEVYRWFLKEDPHSRIAEIAQITDLPDPPGDRAKWPDFFAQHRQDFTRAWADDTLGREWIEAMAGAMPEGIYPPAETTAADILSFSPLHHSLKARLGYVGVLMLDRRDDEAAGLLVTLLRASYHLQRGGALLLTQTIAMAVQRRAYPYLEILAASGRMSLASRAAVAGVLREAPPLSLVFRNAFLGEEIYCRIAIAETKNGYREVVKGVASEEGSRIPSSRFLWRLFFNPNRTAWAYAGAIHELNRLAGLRQLDANKKLTLEFTERTNTWHLKNPVGQLLIQMILPTFPILTERFWATEDQRLALLHQLEKP